MAIACDCWREVSITSITNKSIRGNWFLALNFAFVSLWGLIGTLSSSCGYSHISTFYMCNIFIYGVCVCVLHSWNPIPCPWLFTNLLASMDIPNKIHISENLKVTSTNQIKHVTLSFCVMITFLRMFISNSIHLSEIFIILFKLQAK